MDQIGAIAHSRDFELMTREPMSLLATQRTRHAECHVVQQERETLGCACEG